MRLLLLLICFISFNAYSQEDTKSTEVNTEEFLPIVVEGKEAFMSTKTGEYVYRSHKDTDPLALKTTASGVVYTNTTYHTVKKKESLFRIAKSYNLSVDELKKYNELKASKLSIGQKLKIVKKELVKSSSPVISYVGEERIIARLNPGQSPSTLNPAAGAPGTPQPVQKTPSVTVKQDEEVKEVIEQPTETTKTHIVKRGETLFGIAKKHNITVQKLKNLNNLTLNNLSIGQKLKLQ